MTPRNPIQSINLPRLMPTSPVTANDDPHAFTDVARNAVYDAIFSRRDVRGQFLPKPIPDEVLGRILTAAHHAPSVGFMQPWNFLIVQSPDVKRRVHDAFATAHAEAADMFTAEKQSVYRTLKLEGILESQVGVCVTCDRERSGPTVIGRTHMKTMDLYSSVCAVQNLWLAARAEGLGLGWVSIFHPAALQAALGIPPQVVPIGYLCIGYVSHFYDQPELATAGWLPRLPLTDLVYFEQWGRTDARHPLLEHLRNAEATALRTAATAAAPR